MVVEVGPVKANCEGETDTLLITRVLLPVLVTVTVCALLVVFTTWFPKASAAGLILTRLRPLPARVTGTAADEFVDRVRVPEYAWASVGLKVTL